MAAAIRGLLQPARYADERGSARFSSNGPRAQGPRTGRPAADTGSEGSNGAHQGIPCRAIGGASPEPRRGSAHTPVTSEIDGVPFAEADIKPVSEIVGLMFVLFLAGVETTAGLTSTLFRALAENPEQRALL